MHHMHVSSRRLRRRLAATTAALIALTTAAAVPALGDPIIENSHFKGAGSHIEQEAHGPEWCPNVPFLVEYADRFTAHFLTMTRGADRLWYFSGGFTINTSYTNVENGKALIERRTERGRDTRITDNGDGTITIEGGETGSYVLFGPDGRQIGHDAGRVSFTVEIDTMGTVDPEDDVVLWETIHPATGHFSLDEFDWCHLLEEELG